MGSPGDWPCFHAEIYQTRGQTLLGRMIPQIAFALWRCHTWDLHIQRQSPGERWVDHKKATNRLQGSDSKEEEGACVQISSDFEDWEISSFYSRQVWRGGRVGRLPWSTTRCNWDLLRSTNVTLVDFIVIIKETRHHIQEYPTRQRSPHFASLQSQDLNSVPPRFEYQQHASWGTTYVPSYLHLHMIFLHQGQPSLVSQPALFESA